MSRKSTTIPRDNGERKNRRGPKSSQPVDVIDEHEQESTHNYLRVLAEFSQDLILLMTEEGKQLYANPAISTVLGYAPDERIGSP